MNIITQLDQTVTPAVLGVSGNVAQLSLLEHFYAILINRLAIPEVYQQLQDNTPSVLEPSIPYIVQSTLFEQLWQQDHQRHLLVQELATTHHIPQMTVEALLINTTPLAYQELKLASNGLFLPEFLQLQQLIVRQYLPVWAASVIAPVVAVVNEEIALTPDALIYDNSHVPKAAAHTDQLLVNDTVPVIVESNAGKVATAQLIDGIDAIHANPAAYREPDNHSNVSRAEIRARNQRNDLITRLLLLAAAITVIFLLWFFVLKSDEAEVPVEPVVSAPIEKAAAPDIAPPAQQPLVSAQLMVSVDNSGNLYACSATVGDIGLESALRKALQTSFSEQATICQISVQPGVATSLNNINIETLPDVLTLMRTTPFARLQLQNDSMNLEAPDNGHLQQFLIGVRTLLPTLNITSTAPPVAVTPGNVQPPANTYDETYNNSAYNNGSYNNSPYNNGSYTTNGANPAISNNGSAPITTTNNMMTNQQSQPPAYSNTDSVAPPPPQNSSVSPSSTQRTPDTSDLEKPLFLDPVTNGKLAK